jgi:hypothetical protein
MTRSVFRETESEDNMAIMPVVIVIDEDGDRFTPVNSWKEGLVFHLEKMGCEVHSYDNQYWFLDEIRKTKYAIESGRLLAVIVDEGRYGDDQHLAIIRSIRSMSPTVPVIVIPQGARHEVKGIEGYKRIYRYYYSERRMLSLIQSWKRTLTLPRDHFDARGQSDTAFITRQLLHAYQANLEEDNELGTPDYNGQILAEAFRIRMLPAAMLRREFDDTVRSQAKELADPGDAVFEQELQNVGILCRQDPHQLWRMIKKARGDQSGGSKGEDVEGFAIDPQSLEYARTRGFGSHGIARIYVEQRLEIITELSGKTVSKKPIQITSGIFFPEVSGIRVPIVVLDSADSQDPAMKRIGEFLRQRRIAIPISVKFSPDFILSVL